MENQSSDSNRASDNDHIHVETEVDQNSLVREDNTEMTASPQLEHGVLLRGVAQFILQALQSVATSLSAATVPHHNATIEVLDQGTREVVGIGKRPPGSTSTCNPAKRAKGSFSKKRIRCRTKRTGGPQNLVGCPVTNSKKSRQGNDRPLCSTCKKNYHEICWMKIKACYKCGSKKHFIRDCPISVTSSSAKSSKDSSVPRESPIQQKSGFDSRPQHSVAGSIASLRKSVRSNDFPICNICHKKYHVICWHETGACYKCGSNEHLVRDCPQAIISSPAPSFRSGPLKSRGRALRRTSVPSSRGQGLRSANPTTEIFVLDS